jgi:murein DD-endopeptidase MepM/ murein hydrolase activator NlpD
VVAREALARLGVNHRTAALAVALLSPLRSIVAPFFGSATELLGGDPGRLHPLAQSRKLVEVGADGISHAAHLHPPRIVAAVHSRLAHPDRPERLVPIGVCALLVVAAALSSLPPVGTVSGGAAPTYGPRVGMAGLEGAGSSISDVTGPAAPSLASGGLDYYPGDVTIPNTLAGPEVGTVSGGAAPTYGPRVGIAGPEGASSSISDVTGPAAPSLASGAAPTYGPRVVIAGPEGAGSSISDVTGPAAPSLASGGLDYYARDVTIPNTLAGPEVGTGGQGVLSTYVVSSGDTLGTIAARFDISLTTLYWANKTALPDVASIHVGQRLIIPRVDGLVVVVAAADTIDSLAAKYKVAPQDLMDANSLAGPNIVTGQTLFIPGANGGPIPTPTPAPTAKPKPASAIVSSGGGGSSYTGGQLLWPVRGTISQYFHAGHPALDIAAHSGTPVVAAAGGTVIYAGWKTTGGGIGGGIVVWISHGGGLYTTYNHLSSEIVGVGQRVSAGQRIGSVGMTGAATGPHLHFEVWASLPWGDWTTRGARNPMLYLGR